MTRQTSVSDLEPEAADGFVDGVDATRVRARRLARSALRARLVSLLALSGTLVGCVALGRAVYHLCTDAFVAPLILSSDSELVLPSKLNLARLEAERGALQVRIEQGMLLVRAAEASSQKLVELGETLSQALDWVKDTTAESVRAGTRDLAALRSQRALLRARVREQEAHMVEVRRQLEAGLVRASDLAREQDTLHQLRVAALQFERDQLGSDTELWNHLRAQRALAQGRGPLPGMPELLQHREQLVRIEVELLESESARIGKQAELRIAGSELAKLDALIAEVKQRPIFRAIASQQNVAFVPYTQLDGVAAGDQVHACALWSLFVCKPIGHVSSLLPGEVAAQDPWGVVARGQYALLDLTNPEAARAKMLRVRRAFGARGTERHARVSAP